VEGREPRRAEPRVDVHAGAFGFFLQRRDPCDVEIEVVAEVKQYRRPQGVDSVVDIGTGRIEEDVDILAMSGHGEPGQERTCTLEHPPVGVIRAEQPGKDAVIGELALEFVE
jgi:hypothetical protein